MLSDVVLLAEAASWSRLVRGSTPVHRPRPVASRRPRWRSVTFPIVPQVHAYRVVDPDSTRRRSAAPPRRSANGAARPLRVDTHRDAVLGEYARRSAESRSRLVSASGIGGARTSGRRDLSVSAAPWSSSSSIPAGSKVCGHLGSIHLARPRRPHKRVGALCHAAGEAWPLRASATFVRSVRLSARGLRGAPEHASQPRRSLLAQVDQARGQPVIRAVRRRAHRATSPATAGANSRTPLEAAHELERDRRSGSGADAEAAHAARGRRCIEGVQFVVDHARSSPSTYGRSAWGLPVNIGCRGSRRCRVRGLHPQPRACHWRATELDTSSTVRMPLRQAVADSGCSLLDRG